MKITTIDQNIDWTRRMLRTKDGTPKACSLNVRLILENDERWAGVIGYCRFSSQIMKYGLPPLPNAALGAIGDADIDGVRQWIAEHYGFEPNDRDTIGAIRVVAASNARHPVAEYLQGLEWDGVSRVEFFLYRYFDADDSDDEGGKNNGKEAYIKAVARKFLVAAVARVMNPPVKADCVLILEGNQGVGKSTAITRLFGQHWATDAPFHLGDKDGYLQINGRWCVELAELDSFNKAESTRAKQFFGAITDRYRPPYGRAVEDHPRQCIFVGTTNTGGYLRDSTGNRRYWPVRVGQIDLEALEMDRDQIWAEAYHLYQSGEKWWPLDNEMHLFELEQDARYAEDAWQSIVRDWLESPSSNTISGVTVAEVFQGALDMDPAHMRPPEQQRIGQIMRRLGWNRRRSGPRGKRVWKYFPENDGRVVGF